MFFRQGKFYDYEGARTVAALSHFAKEGYTKQNGKDVPKPATLLGQVQRHLDVIVQDFVKLLATKKNVLLVTFSSGLFLGLLLGCVCNCVGRDAPKAKSKAKTN